MKQDMIPDLLSNRVKLHSSKWLRRNFQGWKLATISVLAVLTFGGRCARADWPEFRGPHGDGLASVPGDARLVGFPLHWSETSNVVWKTAIPYRGWSTPVVSGNQVWLTTATE